MKTFYNENVLLSLLSRVAVRLGEHKLSTNPDCESFCNPDYEEFAVESFKIHECYRSQEKVHDIALIKLSQKVSLKKTKRNVKTVCLPTEGSHDITLADGQQFGWIAGWGSTGNATTKSDVLKYATTPLIAEVYCKSAYETQSIRMKVEDTHLCAGGKGVDL